MKIRVILRILIIALTMFTFTNASCQDWANIKYYEEDNKKLGLPQSGESRVVFMGNSIFENWGKIYPEFFNSEYIERGISGQTTPQMLVRFRHDVIELKPSVVVLLAGTNDIAGITGPSTIEMIAGNIKSMVELARTNNIKVVLCSVLPACAYPWAPEVKPAEKIVELNEWLLNYCIENNIPFVNYFNALADENNCLKSQYSTDGVHVTKEAYQIMEPLTEIAIKQALE